MMKDLAPVVIFTYNRFNHTKNVINSLLTNNLANKSEIFIYSDQGTNEQERQKVSEVRNYLNGIEGFRKINLIYQNQNKGLAASIIEGVSNILKTYDKIIVLEDDLTCSPYFLQYMNEALNFYSFKQAWSISGYSPNIKIPENYKYSTYLAHRNCSWGWATWRENWEKTDWEVQDFKSFITSKRKRKDFERGGNDLSIMLLKQQRKIIHSWSIRFNYSAYKNNLPTIYPVNSLIKNIGVDGSGTNMKRSKKYATSLTKFQISKNHFCNTYTETKTITKRFKNFYNVSFLRQIINLVKLQFAIILVNQNSF